MELPEIELGARVCTMIKENNFKNTPWDGNVSTAVSKIFTNVKKIARKFYAELSELEMLEKLAQYKTEEIMEVLELTNEGGSYAIEEIRK